MLYSLMNNENCNFICLHAEESLNIPSASFNYDPEPSEVGGNDFQGVYAKDITANVLYEIQKSKLWDKNLVLNFNNIKSISGNNVVYLFNEIVKEFCAKEKQVYFINICEEIFKQMKEMLMKYKSYIRHKGKIYYILTASKRYSNFPISLRKNENSFNELYNKRLEGMIEQYSETYDGKSHFSSPVYLSKYINVKKMIENESLFFNFCIYKLAVEMINKKIISDQQYNNKDMFLFFHTLNGSYISTQLAMITKINMVYLDHLGPIESLHKKHFEKCISDNCEYIIVSDVICLGSEVSRAKTIIEYNGGQVKGVACIADIRTTNDSPNPSKASLYTVNNEHNKIDYTIQTELCRNCKKGITS